MSLRRLITDAANIELEAIGMTLPMVYPIAIGIEASGSNIPANARYQEDGTVREEEDGTIRTTE